MRSTNWLTGIIERSGILNVGSGSEELEIVLRTLLPGFAGEPSQFVIKTNRLAS